MPRHFHYLATMKTKEYDLLPLVDDFISKNNRNKRTQAGGKRLTKGTKVNYQHLRKHLESFSTTKRFHLRVRTVHGSKRIFEQEKNYYKRFYTKFTDYLFDDCNHFDNYVGVTIKQLKTVLGWINREKGLAIGEFYKDFYKWKEDIQIIALQPEQLNHLIYDVSFHHSLSKSLRKSKDLFVFGCTTGLRVSDLFALKKTNLEKLGEAYYIRQQSKKTNTSTKIKLPKYAVEILQRNKTRGSMLFKSLSIANFNTNIKKIVELAGWDYIHPKMRNKRGKPVAIYKDEKRKVHYRFCDLVSSHTMRRTAITTFLNLGMDENDVRRISGHSAGSVEFYKYVKFSQEKLDESSDFIFEKLAKKVLISA